MQQNLVASVAAEVRAEMGRRQLSQADLAEVVGLSQQAISRRLSGRVPFDVAELEAISQAWDIPVSRLITARDGAA